MGVGSERRKYNRLVSNPVLEDYALRYAPSTFRKWSYYRIAIDALGGLAALAPFFIGASLELGYGF
ncbi:MAG: hypothetical protein JZD40_00355 [Sulfolobus sp.]|nr:hypothetical protein [Sulfolobus sp.]